MDITNSILNKQNVHTEKRCIYCSKPLIEKQKKYCSRRCTNKWTYLNNTKYRIKALNRSRTFHNAHKNEEEYKSRKIKNTKKWIHAHKRRFNFMMKMRYRKNREIKTIRINPSQTRP